MQLFRCTQWRVSSLLQKSRKVLVELETSSMFFIMSNKDGTIGEYHFIEGVGGWK